MNYPLTSIIAPCYNGESYIRRFLDSILAQTYPAIELILINDGSTDRTDQIIKSYLDKFKSKNIYLNYIIVANAGIGAAINLGLKHIRGDYFTWLGTDDYCNPDYLMRLVEFLEKHKEYSVVRNDGFVVDEEDTSIILGKMADSNRDKHNPKPFMNAILERNFNMGYSLVRTSDFIKTNPQREIYPSRQGQNWQILLPLFYWGKAAFYEEPLYYVVENRNSVSRNPMKKGLDAFLNQREEHKKILVETLKSMDIPDRSYYLNIVENKYIRVRMRAAYNFGNYDMAMREFMRLIKNKAATIRDSSLFLRAIVKRMLNIR